jgi:hypothetical protein
VIHLGQEVGDGGSMGAGQEGSEGGGMESVSGLRTICS